MRNTKEIFNRIKKSINSCSMISNFALKQLKYCKENDSDFPQDVEPKNLEYLINTWKNDMYIIEFLLKDNDIKEIIYNKIDNLKSIIDNPKKLGDFIDKILNMENKVS